MTATDLQATLRRLNAATAELDPPFPVLDLGALDSNRRDLARRAGGKPIRVASKSLRARGVIEEILTHAGFAGILGFTLPEAIWLASPKADSPGLDDVVIGYPSVDRQAIARLASDPLLASRVTLMIDDIAHIRLITQYARADRPIRIAIDVDASWRPKPPGLKKPFHVGARRSPLHDVRTAARLAAEVLADPRLALVGLMFYEAQIAGVGDNPPNSRLRGQLIHAMQGASSKDILSRRPEIVAAVSAEAARRGKPALEFVNAGGTGSLEMSSSNPSVTEVTAGSGFFAPTLFDTYRHFRPEPAVSFALPVVRRPSRGIVTVLGGGYIASGMVDASRWPTPWLPPGLTLDRQEGAGEVQTPLRGEAADTLAIGDRVWFRHAKAGELSERFNALAMIRDDEFAGWTPTYRGEGQAFL